MCVWVSFWNLMQKLTTATPRPPPFQKNYQNSNKGFVIASTELGLCFWKQYHKVVLFSHLILMLPFPVIVVMESLAFESAK